MASVNGRALLAVAASILAMEGAAAGSFPPEPLASSAALHDALKEAGTSLETFVAEWIHLAGIPAPSGEESRRADYLEGRFRQLGLTQVHRDSAGNLLGLLKGKTPSTRRVAFLAHMDTVAPASSSYQITRTPEGRLKGPGVRDDSSGLIALLAALELIQGHRLEPRTDVWVVSTAREETGLMGAQQFIADHGAELSALVAVDGHLGQISYGATGITWLKLHFRAEGAHTLKAHEKPSTTAAVARAIERINEISLRRSPESMETWLNIGMLGGGEVPNAQARDAWFTVDLRSNDPATLGELEARIMEIGRRTAREIGVDFEAETLHRMPGARLPGAADSQLVATARQVLQFLAWDKLDVTQRGTADHNAALVKGIPGIAIGVTTGDGAHTPDEFADIEPLATGIRQLVLLLLLAGGSAS